MIGKLNPLNFIIICICLYLFRTSIPAFKYPFILVFGTLIVNSSISANNIFKNITNLANFRLYVTLLIILILSCFISPKIYLLIFKDIINSIILLIILLLLSLYVKSKKDFRLFANIFIKYLIAFAFFISIYNLLSTFKIVFSRGIQTVDQILSDPLSDIAQVDYNFGSLPIVLGMLSVIYILLKQKHITSLWLYNFALLVFSFSIIFSGSRRSLITFLLIIIALFIFLVFGFLLKKERVKHFARRIHMFLIIFSFILIITPIVVHYSSFNTKNKFLSVIGSENIAQARIDITEMIFRYVSVMDKKKSFREFYNSIWTPVFDPKDPDSTWGLRIHKTVFPLTGKNVQIVPIGTKGYLMDSTCNGDTWDGNAYSYTQILKKVVNKEDTVKVSVYCYVSNDFSGDWASLYSDGPYGIFKKDYDFKKKGEWQKLCLTLPPTSGEVFVHLFFAKYNVPNFLKLKGYVIFAFPQIQINDRLEEYNSQKKETYSNIEDQVTYSSFFNIQHINHSIQYINHPDVIRKVISEFILEDTVYYPIKTDFIKDPVNNTFWDLRIIRWKFALKVFHKEFNIKQKTFGDGFTFLNWYGYYFLGDKKSIDWPHNPFLSILLYSGIIGLLLYCFFLYKVFYYYIKYIKEYPLFFIFFLITFFFAFFSSSSPFDPPVFGFFSILPFFIHAVHKKDKQIEETNN